MEEEPKSTIEEPKYTIDELFNGLPLSLTQFAQKCQISDTTVHNVIRHKAIRVDTANRILKGLSEIYGFTLSVENVVGLQIYAPRSFTFAFRQVP